MANAVGVGVLDDPYGKATFLTQMNLLHTLFLKNVELRRTIFLAYFAILM